MISELKPGERLDDLERNGLMLIQHPGRFCYGVDAVLLSWFAKASEGERVLDFCTGTGVVPILMTAKTAASHFTGLEIQEEVAKMASRSVVLNHLGDKVSIICGDLKNTKTLFGKGVFNVVTVNPPYMAGGSGLVGADGGLGDGQCLIQLVHALALGKAGLVDLLHGVRHAASQRQRPFKPLGVDRLLALRLLGLDGHIFKID